MLIFTKTFLLVLLGFSAIFLCGKSGVVNAEEDETVDEEGVVTPEEDVPVETEASQEEPTATTETTEEAAEEDTGPKKSPDAVTKILFVKPSDSGNIPAGSLVHVIVGFTNIGKTDFLVTNMEASFRYPQDYNYFIQNFTTYRYYKTVEASRQATFEYSFYPSENFNGRPFGLSINLNYEDAQGKQFSDAVFNQTVMITDNDEGFDGETFFLYVTLAALALLVAVILQQTVFSSASKRLTSSKPKASADDHGAIDYDWIPQQNLPSAKRRTSPRNRSRNSGSAGSGDESGR